MAYGRRSAGIDGRLLRLVVMVAAGGGSCRQGGKGGQQREVFSYISVFHIVGVFV